MDLCNINYKIAKYDLIFRKKAIINSLKGIMDTISLFIGCFVILFIPFIRIPCFICCCCLLTNILKNNKRKTKYLYVSGYDIWIILIFKNLLVAIFDFLYLHHFF